MTQPTNNPPGNHTPAAPSAAMRIARWGIVLGLAVGVGVFGIYAINSLAQFNSTINSPQGFGASDGDPNATTNTRTLPGDLPQQQKDTLLALADSSQMVPIAHHPGKIQPFLGNAAFIRPPFRQANTVNEVWEYCSYRTPDAKPQMAFAYYDSQAKRIGLKLKNTRPSSAQRPGGIQAVWSDGERQLQLNAWPTPGAPPPTAAPIRYETPLDWVVKYSYPEPPSTK